MNKIKVIILGNCCVGKSAIINQYINNKFDEESIIENAQDNMIKEIEIEINNKKVILEIWDTAGAENCRAVTRIFMTHSKIALIVYDITNRSSFEELNYYIKEFKKLNEEPIICIAANKCDLFECQEVNREEGEEFAKDNNCLFYETSAIDHEMIEGAFEGLARAYVEQIERIKKRINLKKKYKNGDIYEGNFINDLKEGKGEMEYNNGDKYNGIWKDDKREGKGKLIYSNGDIYNGDWKNDKKEGKGTMEYYNGDTYEGNFINDLKEGNGIMKYKNGDEYNGEWKNNKKMVKDI